jgi:hypothetical protein
VDAAVKIDLVTVGGNFVGIDIGGTRSTRTCSPMAVKAATASSAVR